MFGIRPLPTTTRNRTPPERGMSHGGIVLAWHNLVCNYYSGVAQWLACWAHNPKVRGSKPRSAIWLHGLVHTSSNIRVCRNASSFVFASVRAFCPSVRHFLRGLSSFVMSLCNGCFARSCVRRLSSDAFVVLRLLWVMLHSCAKTVLRTYGFCMP